jgi:hypothetical protein
MDTYAFEYRASAPTKSPAWKHLLPFSLHSNAFAGSAGVSCPAISSFPFSVLCSQLADCVRCSLFLSF